MERTGIYSHALTREATMVLSYLVRHCLGAYDDAWQGASVKRGAAFDRVATQKSPISYIDRRVYSRIHGVQSQNSGKIKRPLEGNLGECQGTEDV
jgi:hypothetical protein